jgi:hypothetical protein
MMVYARLVHHDRLLHRDLQKVWHSPQ